MSPQRDVDRTFELHNTWGTSIDHEWKEWGSVVLQTHICVFKSQLHATWVCFPSEKWEWEGLPCRLVVRAIQDNAFKELAQCLAHSRHSIVIAPSRDFSIGNIAISQGIASSLSRKEYSNNAALSGQLDSQTSNWDSNISAKQMQQVSCQ